ncbi:MAG TPA: hypothetical protein ENG73_06820 [Desulfobacterales bacterium]|nr:hypothetical protein [Desulfobacterales bacterium]
MNIKTFVARNSQEALRKVKEEMGPDAVILKTRTIGQEGGRSAPGYQQIEVTAAIDYEAAGGFAKKADSVETKEFQERWKTLESGLREITHFLIALEASAANPNNLGDLRIPRNHYVYYRHFGVMPENMHLIQHHSRRDVNHSLERVSRKELKECLMDIVSSIKVSKEPVLSGRQKIYAFVGPTGVGKTTTIAKLAAIYKVKKKLRVALVTVDTYRIGAVAQLQTYARIMGLPLEVADNPAELGAALERYSWADIILIDTAGRSPSNREDVLKIGQALTVPYPIYNYLVLSANTELKSLLAAEKAFGVLPLRSYIFTKLDEVIDGGSMINFLLMRKRPVSYFTTGQSVPEDIERATRKRIGELILRRNRIRPVETGGEVVQYGSS